MMEKINDDVKHNAAHEILDIMIAKYGRNGDNAHQQDLMTSPHNQTAMRDFDFAMVDEIIHTYGASAKKGKFNAPHVQSKTEHSDEPEPTLSR